MRVACPSCSAVYDIPDRMLAAGRAVRCARCQHQWVPQAAEPPAVEPPATQPPATQPPPRPAPAEPEPAFVAAEPPVRTAEAGPPAISAMDRLAMEAKPLPGESRGPLRTAWAASVLLLILAAGAAYVWRAPLMEAWPPSHRVYAALGLAPEHAPSAPDHPAPPPAKH